MATPTNVLSWPSEARGADTPGSRPDVPMPGFDPDLGDIAIAYETCKREAEAAGKSLGDHVSIWSCMRCCICWAMIMSVTRMPL